MKANKVGMSILCYLGLFILLVFNTNGISGSPYVRVGDSTIRQIFINKNESFCVYELRYKENNDMIWLNICTDNISYATRLFLCRDLGSIVTVSTETDGMLPRREKKAELHCNGNETSLSECYFRIINSCTNFVHNTRCTSCTTSSQCNGNVCGNNGICVCEPPYFGTACQFKNCSAPCDSYHTCDTQNGACQCRMPFTGEKCELRTCDPPCENGGVCILSGQCRCMRGISGQACENITVNNINFDLIIGNVIKLIIICVIPCILLTILFVIIPIMVMVTFQCTRITQYIYRKINRQTMLRRTENEIEEGSENIPQESDNQPNNNNDEETYMIMQVHNYENIPNRVSQEIAGRQSGPRAESQLYIELS